MVKIQNMRTLVKTPKFISSKEKWYKELTEAYVHVLKGFGHMAIFEQHFQLYKYNGIIHIIPSIYGFKYIYISLALCSSLDNFPIEKEFLTNEVL